MQIVLNGRTFKYHFGGGRFHILPQCYEFSYGLCLNCLLQVRLIGNQIDQAPLFRYNNRDDEVSFLVRVRTVLEGIKYLMTSVKGASEAVGIWTEDNWDVKRLN